MESPSEMCRLESARKMASDVVNFLLGGVLVVPSPLPLPPLPSLLLPPPPPLTYQPLPNHALRSPNTTSLHIIKIYPG
ncbi:hypothetical protein Syun_025455 [Stephania yunnanensis]|uniref:Uncharacterized protein n=1 Tax=Stephania yunnanensis TaxID=152371 RepID=A0AAP0ERP2_9MAGN